MTQPPPPPNQPPGPPQGGFGAPQDPPAGGFGAPTPPPAQPQYGYPQQPPTQPQGQPSAQPQYGYPQQPDQAAGQPQYGYPQQPPTQPMGQPQYGYPTQPQYGYQPTPPPGSGGGKKLTTQMQIIIAAVVAVVLIIGGGVWYASSGDDEPANEGKGGSSQGTDGGKGKAAADGPGKEKVPSNVQSKVSFQLPHPKVTDVTDVAGSWVTDKAYVKTGVNSIVGYDLAKGTPVWTLALPGQVCATSRHATADNKTAIVYEASKRLPPRNYQPCTEVAVVDLVAGKLVWTKSVTSASSGDDKVKFSEVTLSGTTVAAGGTDGGAAFDLANGNPRWKPQANAENCYDMGYGGGAGLVAARKCGPYDSQYVVIQNLNPATGAPISQFKMPAGVKYASIVSTKPLVVAADVGDTADDGSGISDFFSIDEATGKLKVKIAADADRFAARCRSTEVETCSKVVVGNGRIYLPTEDHEGSGEYGDTNEIVSFDLATGKPTSDKADAGDRYSMFPLRMDGGNVIAYKTPPYDKGGQIVSIDGATFKQTTLLENPGDEAVRDAESSFSSDYAEILYSGGRMFISETMISEPRKSAGDDKEYLVVAYSTTG
ncbi:PQQ-binding-like beta-propeller repeat protein [Streptomyces solicathayae]|uniref:PQQ-binding-like beta-propeller repeat protein n=1 Tax=Streptomyces solicathayae TaxID=3081768 RepID=A0ABZ0LX85_9ACTN|nr:PQQ-binding-like beta-propeller repeat protein [Streptomyces sp. HUAS YS2]WOX23925.1 PQQ-binding-like beta-propeller repeat protein [Streptomyces sp. HUAS YS2]